MANVHSQMSPRQKMINLMYIVLTAMLALNVSSDVLDGFTQVDEGLKKNNSAVADRNESILDELSLISTTNPTKAGQWYSKASQIHHEAKSLYATIDSLKFLIIKEADGKDANPEEIKNRENLDAASIVMLGSSSEGKKLKENVEVFRASVLDYVTDSVKRTSIENLLSTSDVRNKENGLPVAWENFKFENQPVVAAITLLSKLQNDILYAEGESLSSLLAAVDAGDLRVNELKAFVIPQSKVIVRGAPYSADILLGAVDTTARPEIFIGGRKIDSSRGHYQFFPSGTGKQTLSGYLEVKMGDGSTTQQPFSTEYTVIEPSATISPTMMNVLYAGIDNPIDIAVPGMLPDQIKASMSGGTIVKNGSKWIARTSGGKEVTVTVSADNNGRNQVISTHTFKVRNLPDPTAYINLSGSGRYRGGKPIAKTDLMGAPGLEAAIDDGILDVKFTVKEFETVFFDSMGNAMLQRSDGSNFSSRQKEAFRRLSSGKRFFISRIKAVGPDGKERILNPIEIIVN